MGGGELGSPGEPESVEIDEILTAEGTDISSLIADNDDLQATAEELARWKPSKTAALCAWPGCGGHAP